MDLKRLKILQKDMCKCPRCSNIFSLSDIMGDPMTAEELERKLTTIRQAPETNIVCQNCNAELEIDWEYKKSLYNRLLVSFSLFMFTGWAGGLGSGHAK